MITFKEIEISDKGWIDAILNAADRPGCHYNFTNMFAWGNIYQYRVAKLENCLVVKGWSLEGVPYYLYPAGEGDYPKVLEAMVEDAASSGNEFRLAGLSDENIAEINTLFPDKFEYAKVRDSYDYVYLLDKLVTLSGRNLSAKRNHINHFKRDNNWAFEQVSSENIGECWEMTVEWCNRRKCQYDIQLENESCAVRQCFDHFFELGLEGGLIRSGGRVIAYTMGEKLNSDTYDIHIEKAFDEIQGAYQIINHEFAIFIQENHPELIYVNREEDMGQEGLRKAKLSYHPVRMEEKSWGKFAG
ncbi:hypothetical protein Sgly_1990 [Syntrophobotulus glycolicus DSM 8271]|uniref:Phosphatidylglycerol lysyltransferase C-terminal domain-containing protein n=1 Tax=Syntrophobotulus glycolicus (strain DSM 8271 / FlGlyR) TaxID=645991 RepID=F0T1E4_SYNGF|nr:phosphatidylglycerol lysyltransferase domain-containing protein [Syntrophobotulus glycolicus]ADY56285.1 hypothetical protein Sgly_1990 [Syntrophobotulus glycolicus DSM 8271]